MDMGKIIAIVNQKGGVGKTTTAVNLTATLHDLGVRVLLCDFDPQANATSGLGINKRKLKKTVYDVVINGDSAESAIVSTPYGDVLPSTGDLAGAAVELINMDDRSYRLAKALESVKSKYDVIFIDCPPSLEMLTVNALCAAQSIVVPVQCEYFALEGLSDLMSTLRSVKKRMNPSLEIFGVVLTMYDGRWPRKSAGISPARCLPPPFPGTSVWPKRPATAFPSPLMTGSAGAASPTRPWPRSLRQSYNTRSHWAAQKEERNDLIGIPKRIGKRAWCHF